MLRPGQLLYAYLHLAPDPEQAKGLQASGVTAVAYETVQLPDGSLPLLALAVSPEEQERRIVQPSRAAFGA